MKIVDSISVFLEHVSFCDKVCSVESYFYDNDRIMFKMLEHYNQVGIRIIMCKCSIFTCFPYFHNTMLIKTSSYMYINIRILYQTEKKCTCFPHLKLSGSLYIYIKTWCFKKNVYFISSLNKKFYIIFTNFFNSYFFICIKSQHLTFL